MDNQEGTLPEKLLNEIEENCSSFAMFYYDFAGNPVLYTFYPSLKDKMAMLTFMGEYLSNQPPLLTRDPKDDEGGKEED